LYKRLSDVSLRHYLLHHISSIALADGEQAGFIKLLVAEYLVNSSSETVHYLEELLNRLKSPNIIKAKQHSAASLGLEQARAYLRDVEDAVAYLMRVLGSSDRFSKGLQEEIVGLQAKANRNAKLAQRIVDRYERTQSLHLKILSEKSSQRIDGLTILVVIFLPLSLASGILSMTTRVNDLHLLLYDFFGVSSFVAAAAVMACAAVWLFLKMERYIYETSQDQSRVISGLHSLSFSGSVYVFVS